MTRTRLLQLALVALLLTLGARDVTAQDPDRPGYQKLRYEEDWSFLQDPARRTDPFDVIKYIPLTRDGRIWFSLGGEIRERYEYKRNPLWGEDPQDQYGAFFQRYVLGGDLHLGRHLRVFGQLLSALEDGRAGSDPSPIDENRLDLQQAFVDLSLDLAATTRATLRVGRQEMTYGSGRLVDVREGPNVRRNFNGVRVHLLDGALGRLDGIAVRPSDNQPGVFDDDIDNDQSLWGVYAIPAPTHFPIGLDLYYLGYSNSASSYQQGTASETRQTVGARIFGERAGWDWNWELIYQWGRFGDGNIDAWSVASDTGYTVRAMPWTPRLGLSANVASGDRDSSTRGLQTFNPLFPRGSYFSELALLGPRNFFNVHPFLSAVPIKHVVITLDVDSFWRLQTGDGVYSPSGQLLRSGADSTARYVGTEPSFNATWQVTPRVTLTGIYSHFFPGRFIRDTGPSKDIDFFEVTARVLF